jgi:putative ABC transport system permease protein
MNELTLPLRNLAGQPIRTFLTTLGIAVAVAGFVALTGLTQGVQQNFAGGIGDQGGDLMVSERNSFSIIASSIPETAGTALKAVPGVADVSGTLVNITTADDNANIVISGWPDGSFLWRSVKLAEGRLPQASDEWPVVLGSSIADGLKKKVGDTVSLQFQDFTVVGIADFDSVLNQNIALVPLPKLQSLLGREGTVTLFQVRLDRPLDPDRIAAAKAGLQKAAPDNQVSDSEEFGNSIRFFSLIRAIASTVSLVVMAMAALAIANTLLMAVTERTFEIGILASLGWRPVRILRLILTEGLIMSVIGGIIGLGLGIVAMNLVSKAGVAAGLMEPYLTKSIIIQSLVAALLAGPIGALYPAWRATRLVPAEALRRT